MQIILPAGGLVGNKEFHMRQLDIKAPLGQLCMLQMKPGQEGHDTIQHAIDHGQDHTLNNKHSQRQIH